MRRRLVVLGILAVGLGVAFVVCTMSGAELLYQGQRVFANLDQQQPTEAQIALSNALYRQASTLQLLLSPLATGSLVSALAILVVLGRRWQLREAT